MLRSFVAIALIACELGFIRAESPLMTVDGEGRLSIVGSFGHSHNDYLQELPLETALNAGMLGIEADVFLIDDDLYVAHEREEVRPERTLSAMYLQPLNVAFQRLGGVDEATAFRGRVRESGLPVVLLIDFKNEGERAWRVLESQLAEYPGLCRRVVVDEIGQTEVIEGPAIVVVSGDRPLTTIAAAKDRRSAIDGRYPEDLASDYPAHLMPMVSIGAPNLAPFATSHDGGMPAVLADFARRARDQGRIARVWATPDTEATWRELSDAGMQLINTDQPKRLEEFLKSTSR